MLPRDVIQKIRQIEISTRRTVNDVLGGQYHSVFKGRGMEFSEVREYQPGDDIRSIDWNVTARTGHPFIKKFTEERELTVMLLVDVSGSEIFGSVRQLKNELAAEVAAVLGYELRQVADVAGRAGVVRQFLRGIVSGRRREVVVAGGGHSKVSKLSLRMSRSQAAMPVPRRPAAAPAAAGAGKNSPAVAAEWSSAAT